MRGLIRAAAIKGAAAAGASVLAGATAMTAVVLSAGPAAADTVTGVEAALPANAGPNPVALVQSVSCASAGNCSAVGGYRDNSSNFQGLLLTQSSGTWATGVEAQLPAGAGSGQDASLQSVSCASAGNCTAVGGYTDSSDNPQGLLVTETSGTWGAGVEAALPANASAAPNVELFAVSCVSAGDCTAVGFYTDNAGNQQGVLLTETSGTWGTGVEASLPAGAPGNPEAQVISVSCAAVGDCTAAGSYVDSSGSEQGLLLTETSGAWGTGVEASLPANAGSTPNAFMNSVSCASAGNCTAVGDYSDNSGGQGLLLTETSGTWGTGVEASLPANAGSDPGVSVTSVSCTGAGDCTAVGEYLDGSFNGQGLLLTETSGTWGTGAEAIPPAGAAADPSAQITSVSCASAGDCTAAGTYAAGGSQFAMLLTQTSGSWAAGVAAHLPANAGPAQSDNVLSVSCAAAGTCAAGGDYLDSSSHQQGLLLGLSQAVATCSGLTIANQAPTQTGKPGASGTWSFTVSTRNCTGGTLTAMTVRGLTATWITGATAAVTPAKGTLTIQFKPHGQAITWQGFSRANLARASITVTVSGTVPGSTLCGASLPISGSWSASGQTATGATVSSKHSKAAAIQVTC